MEVHSHTSSLCLLLHPSGCSLTFVPSPDPLTQDKMEMSDAWMHEMTDKSDAFTSHDMNADQTYAST